MILVTELGMESSGVNRRTTLWTGHPCERKRGAGGNGVRDGAVSQEAGGRWPLEALPLCLAGWNPPVTFPSGT